MCGLSGYFCKTGLGNFRSSVLSASLIAKHRGPDGEGLALFDTRSARPNFLAFDDVHEPPERAWAESTLALSHRRLAILDLSPSGRQPMTNEDESLWIVFNGEIYNFVELRAELEKAGHTFHSRSDTEVILHAYEEWGEACTEHFQGMWAFALVDLKQRRLFCSRDRFGIKPFHYFYDGKHFAFGSEIKQLLEFPFVPRQLNQRAVFEFLAYSAVDYCEETFFSGIDKLMQGHSLTLDLESGAMAIKRYYDPTLAVNDQISEAEAADEFRRLLSDSVRMHLRSDVEVGSCLSGGLDSSSLVCIMNRLLAVEGKGAIQRTFSSHFDEAEANELEFMQVVIRKTGVKASFIYPKPDDLLHDLDRMVWHQDEPFGSTSIFAQWSVFKLVQQNQVKVMLDGQGADELLGGYVTLAYYFFNELEAKGDRVKLLWELLRYAQFHGEGWKDVLPTGRLGDRLRRIRPKPPRPPMNWIRPERSASHEAASRYLPLQQTRPFGDREHLSNILHQLTFHTNLQALLRHEDRNSMAFSVESRVPFLDHRLVEFIFGLPSRLKIRNGYTKRVLRDSMEGVIPEKIRWRTSKLGFATPERKWQKTVLRPLVANALKDERVRSFVDPDRANEYLDRVEAMGVADNSAWRWINLHLWMNAYKL